MENDKILYKDFLEGNTGAFEELVLKHKDNLIYFLQRYIKDIYTCEDIAQDVFAYVFAFSEKYNFDFSFKTFLYTLAKNKAVDYIRKQSRQLSFGHVLENEQKADEYELVEKVIKDEDAMLVHSCLKKLTSDYQAAIYLVDIEEQSYVDAARIMGKSVAQFKVLIFRARKALKQKLEKGGYTN